CHNDETGNGGTSGEWIRRITTVRRRSLRLERRKGSVSSCTDGGGAGVTNGKAVPHWSQSKVLETTYCKRQQVGAQSGALCCWPCLRWQPAFLALGERLGPWDWRLY
ncbi:MAG TPA: hypothetical protein VD994_10405, partial [Prosthecobacter sp.]|nr:hypothetical protein [Prosthecobacter sp.]